MKDRKAGRPLAKAALGLPAAAIVWVQQYYSAGGAGSARSGSGPRGRVPGGGELLNLVLNPRRQPCEHALYPKRQR